MKSRLEQVRSEIESRIPGAFRNYDRSAAPILETGDPALDEFGIPAGGLTQVCAPPDISSGSTTLMIALLAQLTAKDRYCALVDSTDAFDPESADEAGVALNRLLWVRCAPDAVREAGARTKPSLKPLEQAFKAADILIQDGSFAMVAVDLRDIDEKAIRKVPMTTWFRFSRVVEKTETVLLFLVPYPAAQSCAALTIRANGTTPRWHSTSGNDQPQSGHTVLLGELEYQFEIIRDRNRKTPQRVKPKLSLKSKQA